MFPTMIQNYPNDDLELTEISSKSSNSLVNDIIEKESEIKTTKETEKSEKLKNIKNQI